MDTYINKRSQIYVILSKWGYPFGGGEEFLYTTMEWAKKLGMRPYWICFYGADNIAYKKLEINKIDSGYIIRVPGGYSEKILTCWIKLLKPDFVHHQGHMRKEFQQVCKKMKVQFLTGFHFWHDAIILDPMIQNVDILQNYKKHLPDPNLKYFLSEPNVTLYVASQFVRDCIEKISNVKIDNCIIPASSKRACLIDYCVQSATYVTMINVHYLKGGEIFLYLLENCPDVQFMGIKTEYGSEELDEKIASTIEKRNKEGKSKSILLNRVSNLKDIYKNTKILLVGSLVDETFCRVANEGMMNGIPIISTGKGNIINLMEESGYVIDPLDHQKWKDTINNLYKNPQLLDIQYNLTKKSYNTNSEEIGLAQFSKVIQTTIVNSYANNIMIITPWCDQGLGIQSRNYMTILTSMGYKVFIFGLKPYNADSSISLQKNLEEWLIDKTMGNVYYSKNDREHITDAELDTFTKKYEIGKCIIPETCWFRVFEVAKYLRNKNIKCYAVPNIEIVRRDELYKHTYFYKILCNNDVCKNLLNDNGIMNTEYIGYGINMGIKNSFDKKTLSTKNNTLSFLFIGGMNAFSRKQILDICGGFCMAYEIDNNIKLTCTIQKINKLEEGIHENINQYIDHPGITFIQDHINYNQILDLYRNHHISIQVSKHEGLGLGFYEALATDTPIISLDTPPHNELVLDEINGWLLPCHHEDMLDNPNSLLKSARFLQKDLADKIIDIKVKGIDYYNRIIDSLREDYSSRLEIDNFVKNIANALS